MVQVTAKANVILASTELSAIFNSHAAHAARRGCTVAEVRTEIGSCVVVI